MLIISGMIDAGMGRKQIIVKGDSEDFKCSFCKKFINEGFLCENTQFSQNQLILCQECQDTFDMTRCTHDKEHTHRHIKWFKSDE